jgi:hypothetical protein
MHTDLTQPVNRRGFKSLNCPFYGDCLGRAAERNWHVWTCEECPSIRLASVCQKLRYIAPYYRLLAEIYPEFKRKYEPLMNSLEVEG